MPEEARRRALAAEAATQRGRRLVTIMLSIGALLLVITVGAAARTAVVLQDANEWVEHTLSVQSHITALQAKGERVETARRGYLLQPHPRFVEIVLQSSRDFATQAAALEAETADNPRQQAAIRRIMAINAEREALVRQIFASKAVADEVRKSDFLNDRGTALTRSSRNLLAAMFDEEKRLYATRNARQGDILRTFYLVAGLGFILLVGVLLAAVAVVTRTNKELLKAEQRLRLVNQSLENTVEARTAELRRANEEIQRFAYIVSHDLRSPLVNVLGFTSELDAARKTLQSSVHRYAEINPAVVGTPPWLAIEEDIPEALGFIRTSTEKMDRLINSILELSRQGRRTLAPEPLSMTTLAKGVVANLHQLSSQAGAEVEVDLLPDVESDRLAIEQILANLVENAIKYLEPGRPGRIRITGRNVGSDVEYDVVDNGRGIGPADRERVFELFRRAGPQDQSGEGIGLANVRALAYRLGGRMRLESQLGKGSTFRLILPKNFVMTEVAT